jgi:hypothetical protein
MTATSTENHAPPAHAPDATGRRSLLNDDPIVLLLYGEEHVNLALADELALDGYEVRRASDTAKLRAVCSEWEAFETGDLSPARFNERLSSLDARLDSLHGQDQALARELAADTPTTPDAAALNAVADQLGQVIETGDPDQAKALLRILIAELRVNSRSEILPTYRVGAPVVCAQTSSVERTGIEPMTSYFQNRLCCCAARGTAASSPAASSACRGFLRQNAPGAPPRRTIRARRSRSSCGAYARRR